MDNLARQVIEIPARPQLLRNETQPRHLRVAAYCRVSTDEDEQLTSYKAQMENYTEKINANPDWKMAGIFADEGLSGTSTKKRGEFLKLMELCKKGKIDLILTKSISRFARNTLDSISYVRALKAMGVGVAFEKENINTLYMSNEMVFTMLSAFAQAESESISANVKWGKRHAVKNGNVPFQYSRLLGYQRGADNCPEIVPEEAATVRKIYAMYLAGYSILQIKRRLEAEGSLPKTGKSEWSQASLSHIFAE